MRATTLNFVIERDDNMLVTCKICKNKIDKDTAYKVIVNGKNIYFCSEKEFVDDDRKKKKIKMDKDSVYNEIVKIFGYLVQNSQLFKEWTTWNALKSDEIIAKYLEENEDYLSMAIGRLTGGEYCKIRYFSTILKNSLHDFVPTSKNITYKIETDNTIYDSVCKTNNKRRSLSELEDEIDG